MPNFFWPHAVHPRRTSRHGDKTTREKETTSQSEDAAEEPRQKSNDGSRCAGKTCGRSGVSTRGETKRIGQGARGSRASSRSLAPDADPETARNPEGDRREPRAVPHGGSATTA